MRIKHIHYFHPPNGEWEPFFNDLKRQKYITIPTDHANELIYSVRRKAVVGDFVSFTHKKVKGFAICSNWMRWRYRHRRQKDGTIRTTKSYYTIFYAVTPEGLQYFKEKIVEEKI